MLPPSPPSPHERAAAARRHREVLTRARRIHRRRIWAPRAVLVLAVGAAVGIPLTLGGKAGGFGIHAATTPTVVVGSPFAEHGSAVASPGGSTAWAYLLSQSQQVDWTSFTLSGIPEDGQAAQQGTVAVLLIPHGSSPGRVVYQTSLASLAAGGPVTEQLSPALTVPPGRSFGIVVDCTGGEIACAAGVTVAGTVTVASGPPGSTSTTTTIPASVVPSTLGATASPGTSSTQTTAAVPEAQYDVTRWTLTDLGGSAGGKQGSVVFEVIEARHPTRVLYRVSLQQLSGEGSVQGTFSSPLVLGPAQSAGVVLECGAGQPDCHVQLQLWGTPQDASSPNG